MRYIIHNLKQFPGFQWPAWPLRDPPYPKALSTLEKEVSAAVTYPNGGGPTVETPTALKPDTPELKFWLSKY